MKKYRKKILMGVFLVVVFALTVWSVFRGQDLNALLQYLTEFDSAYFIPCILCVLAFIIGESVIIYYLMHVLETKVKFSHCCLYSFIGFFYCLITPSASGGQPMQLLAMRKDKIPVAVSTIVLAIITIVYKFVLVLIGAVVLIIQPAALMQHLDGTMVIIYIGMALNVIFIALLFFVVFDSRLVRTVGDKTLRLANRIRPLKNLERAEARLENFLAQYEGTADFFRSHKLVIINVFGITLVQRWVLFVITWLTYLAFNLSGDGFMMITTLQGMVSVAVDMLPLPGGMGFSENMFLIIFDDIFGADMVLAGMVVSRGISYYIQLAICALMTIVAAFVLKDRSKDAKVSA